MKIVLLIGMLRGEIMKSYKFSISCKKYSCKRKPKYYSIFSVDIDSDGNREGWCEKCFKVVHQFHEFKLVCEKCGKPLTDKAIHSTAYGKKLFCSLNCAANYLGYRRKSEFKE